MSTIHPVSRSLRAALALGALAAAGRAQGPPPVPPLQPPPFPAENPFSEPKRVLGKLLFWEEQLSSDDTLACGTCHLFQAAGGDPRAGRHPGLDGAPFTLDDKLASPGVRRADAADDYQPDATFGFEPQVTARAANAPLMAAWAPELFWDGRARSTFVDPESGQVLIASGGALESQVVAPPVSDVEMAHAGRDWGQIAAKLRGARPMSLATDLPADMAAAIAGGRGYPALFADAFGDDAITAARIAFAIATYERTLIPDQTPWDAFNAGDPAALTPQQQQGLNVFSSPGARCNVCHTPPLFTNNGFRNIGLRPVAEDTGRQQVTGNPADRGRFKVPSLRNVGLKTSFMHNGGVTNGGMASVREAVEFYLPAGGHVQFPDNQDPIIPGIGFPPQALNDLVAFLQGGLTDPRVAAETFPFDRPTLFSERAVPDPELLGGATPGSGGFAPRMIAASPPLLGSQGFKLGVAEARGGAPAFVVVSTQPPASGAAFAARYGPIVLEGAGDGQGYATWHRPLPADPAWAGRDLFVWWEVVDPAAAGGVARSEVARLGLVY